MRVFTLHEADLPSQQPSSCWASAGQPRRFFLSTVKFRASAGICRCWLASTVVIGV